MANQAKPLRAVTPTWRSKVPGRGRRRLTNRALANVRTSGRPTSPAQRLFRLARSSPNLSARRSLTRSNRRGTDPYARWCGRGDVVRRPPIPINRPYAARRIRPRSAPPGRSVRTRAATTSRSSSTIPPSPSRSTRTCSTLGRRRNSASAFAPFLGERFPHDLCTITFVAGTIVHRHTTSTDGQLTLRGKHRRCSPTLRQYRRRSGFLLRLRQSYLSPSCDLKRIRIIPRLSQ